MPPKLANSPSSASSPPAIVLNSGSNSPVTHPRAGMANRPNNRLLAAVVNQEKPAASAPSTPASLRRILSSRSMSDLSVAFMDLGRETKDKFNENFGIFLAFVSGVMLTLYSFLYKNIKDDISRTTVLGMRGVLQFSALFAFARIQGVPTAVANLPKDTTARGRATYYAKLVLVSVLGGIRLCLLFTALQLSPTTTVHTILNGNPIVVMILSQCLLKNDLCTSIKTMAGTFLFAGIMLNGGIDALSNVDGDLTTIVGLGFAVGALLFSALGSVITKQISKNFDKRDISSYIGISILVVGVSSYFLDDVLMMVTQEAKHAAELAAVRDTLGNATVDAVLDSAGHMTNISCVIPRLVQEADSDNATDLFEYVDVNDSNETDMVDTNLTERIIAGCQMTLPPYLPDDLKVWFYAFVVAVMGIIQQFCLIAAIKYDSPSRVTMVRSLQIVLTFILSAGIMTGKELPDPENWFGAAFVLAAVFSVAFESNIREWFKRKSKTWKWLGLLLPCVEGDCTAGCARGAKDEGGDANNNNNSTKKKVEKDPKAGEKRNVKKEKKEKNKKDASKDNSEDEEGGIRIDLDKV